MSQNGHDTPPELSIVAANLAALMAHAVDNPDLGWPASKKGLERWIENRAKHHQEGGRRIVRATIQRVLKSEASPGVDTLGIIAAAYGLSAWQMLVPNLDPAQPPMLLGHEAVEAIMQSLRTVATKHDATASRRSPTGADRDRTSAASRKMPRKSEANPLNARAKQARPDR